MWKYDGTNAPSMVANIRPGSTNSSSPNDFIVFNNELYFEADGSNGYELWKYNGVNTPSMVADINLEVCGSILQTIVFNNALYFVSSDGLTEMNCGSMMELMLQVWLLISIQVAIHIPRFHSVYNDALVSSKRRK